MVRGSQVRFQSTKSTLSSHQPETFLLLKIDSIHRSSARFLLRCNSMEDALLRPRMPTPATPLIVPQARRVRPLPSPSFNPSVWLYHPSASLATTPSALLARARPPSAREPHRDETRELALRHSTVVEVPFSAPLRHRSTRPRPCRQSAGIDLLQSATAGPAPGA
jgi:hypothetical protein